MFKSYFTTAFRNILRHKAFSAINILGLSIGLSAAFVIFMIVHHEYSFDTFQKDGDRIYRVVLDASFNGQEGHSAGIPAPLGAAIENEVTGIEQTVPVFQQQGDGTATVSITKKSSDKPVVFKRQPNIVFTNGQYFSLLPYRWIAGSAASSLQTPFSVVISESRAKQYFPAIAVSEIMGRQITYNEITATVTGVVKDLKENTSFTAVEFISLPTIAKTNLQQDFMMNVWDDWMAYAHVYVKLSKGIPASKTTAQLNTLYRKYNKKAWKDEANHLSLSLQPLSDIHFNGRYPGVGDRVAQKPALYGLMAIGAFLLLLGCINFINLTTANATQRAKEIGVRKTMGGSRRQLIAQFLCETVVITAIATLLSFVLTPVLLNMFAGFIPDGIHFDPLQSYVYLFIIILIPSVSFLAGLYPALILSGYKPVAVLKSQSVFNTGETRHAWIRKTLTVSQFVIAQFFIIATIMVSKQINYSVTSDMGFQKDGIITFNIPRDTVATHGQQLLNAINNLPEVALASTGFLSPADMGVAFTNVTYAPKKDLNANIQIRWGDPNYLEVYKIKLLAGRNVLPSDKMKEFIINSTYAKLLGFQKPEDALGEQLNFNGNNLPIVGVIQDFHDLSTHAPISAVVFAGNTGSTFHIRLKPYTAGGNEWHNGISKIEKAYKEIYPGEIFEYKFFDETIASLYAGEQRIATLLKWATGLTIVISCLGLLGLVMYTINTRTKEIGVRKILGASVTDIVIVLSRNFMRLIGIAFIIGASLAWWAMHAYLQNYAYRTSLSWWVFVASGAFMFLLALITLSAQTIKAAVVNPVKSLRTD
jgi:putative ABC transport system permease protein